MHLILLVLGLPIFIAANEVSYAGFKLYTVIMKSNYDVDMLRKLETVGVARRWSTFRIELDRDGNETPIRILVNAEHVNFFLMQLSSYGIEYSVIFDDLQEVIYRNMGRNEPEAGFSWTRYHTLKEIYNWVDILPYIYPQKVEIINAGCTYEGRDIKGVKISFRENNPGVFIEAGIHASEWIGPATATYIINELLAGTHIKYELLVSYDWYIFPVFNPDGYEFTFTGNRLWRKNRSRQYDDSIGVDLNRNWGYKTHNSTEAGNSENTNPRSESFAGPEPFSEIESASMSTFLLSIKANLFAYISFHSFSQLLIAPYANSYKKTRNYQETVIIGQRAANALSQRYGTNYKFGISTDFIMPVEGILTDWVKDVLEVPIVYTYELRDSGYYGKLLPAEQIIPNSEEVLDSLIVILQEAERFGYPQRSY